MNVGDTVVDVRSVGTIIGVSKGGNPVVQWDIVGEVMFEEEYPEMLILVELPKPVDELNPAAEEFEEDEQWRDEIAAKHPNFSYPRVKAEDD